MSWSEGVVTWLGIDYHQYVHLVKASIRMDFRSESLMPDRSGRSSISPLTLNIMANGLFSILIATIMAFNLSLGILMAFVYSMLNLSLVVLIEFGSTIVNPDDLQILGPRPITSRTYFAAKFTNLIFYVGIFTLAMNLVPAIAGAFFKDSRAYYPLIHLPAAFMAALFTAGLLATLYGFLLRLFNYERFKDIITYCQIVLMFLLFIGYQIVPRALPDLRETSTFASPWLYLVPPVWFARMVELGLGQYRTENVYAAVTGLLAVVITYSIMLRTLSLSYAEHLSRLMVTRRDKAPREPTVGWRRLKTGFERLLLSHSQERAIFYFIGHMFRRSRFVKRQFYPNIGINLAIYALNAFERKLINPFVDPGFHFSFALAVPVTTFVIITYFVLGLLPYSDEYKGHWIFDVAPLDDKRHIMAGIKKAVLIFFYPPTFLLNFLLFAYYWPWPYALGHTGYGMIAGLIFLQIYASLFSAIPFTQVAVKGKVQASIIPILFLMPFIIGLSIGLQVLALKWRGEVGFLALCTALLILAGLLNALSNTIYAERDLLTAEQ